MTPYRHRRPARAIAIVAHEEHRRTWARRLLLLIVGLAAASLVLVASSAGAADQVGPTINAEELARTVTIYRDSYGVPHIDAPTDAGVAFGMAYCQCEDFFWQVEDNYILGLGRYSEVYGRKGLNSDLLNRAFEVVPTSEADYAKMEPEIQRLFAGFTEGINYYLAKNPQVKPRLITHYEPWYVVALGRQLILELGFRFTHLSGEFMPRSTKEIWTVTGGLMPAEATAQIGSNAWAIGPSKTKSGKAMLYINPHQPWFGFGQFYEAHQRSAEGGGWNFTGATFFGNPLPGLGHNEYLGWSFTTNEPDIADAWVEKFDDPKDPLKYKYGNEYRTATEWKAPIKIKSRNSVDEKTYTFRKTHHGPLVAKKSDTEFISARVARLYDGMLARQIMKLVRAKNFAEFRAGMGMLNFQFMNATYADRDGNIFYLYNGTIPRRDPQFDWTKPVDGSDPRTEWNGYHPISELPQVLNPAAGFVQNCNSTPFTTSDDDNPGLGDFPRYMCEDRYDDKRRAKISRMILREMKDVTFEDWQKAALDTRVYWAMTELPRLARELDELAKTDPTIARQAAPYFEHLKQWNCEVTNESTQGPLCAAWYEELYGFGYPAETLKPEFIKDPKNKFVALVRAASKLKGVFGDWKVKWGDVYRIQRHPDVADFFDIPFDDNVPSVPCPGLMGPLGCAFVVYYTPSINIPLVRTVKKHYGVVGNTYMSTIEFGEKVKATSLIQFGQSADPKSPHYMDQAELLSQKKFKPELFYWDDVVAGAKQKYHPGEPVQTARK